MWYTVVYCWYVSLFTAVCLTVVYNLVPRPGLGTRLCCLLLVCLLLLFTDVGMCFTVVYCRTAYCCLLLVRLVVYCWYICCCLLLICLIVYCWYISKITSNLKTIFTIIYVHNVCDLRHYYMTCCEDGVT